MPNCKSIIIGNIAEKTTSDGIFYKLEHDSVGGRDCIWDRPMLGENNRYAIVHFKNPEGKSQYSENKSEIEAKQVISNSVFS